MRIVAILACLAYVVTPSAVSHDPLGGLVDLIADEAAMLDTVRAIDLEQRAMAVWEDGVGGGLASAGKREDAARVFQSMRQRHRTIQDAYLFVLNHYPENAKANNYYGDALFDFAGQEMKAVEYWRKATVADAGFAPPFVSLGNHYTHEGNYAEGFAAFDKAIAAQPDDPEAYYHLVQVYLINWPDLEKILDKSGSQLYSDAMQMSEKATLLAPDDFELARDYALNFFAGDRMQATVDWPKAAQAWERANTLAPSTTMRFQTWLYQARAHIRSENHDAAEKALLAALEIYPDNELAQELLQKVRTRKAPEPAP